MTANEIRIPVGRQVEIELSSPDVIHSFWVPSLAGKVDMIPGMVNRIRVRAASPGIYRGQCAEYCGGPHAMMAFMSWCWSRRSTRNGLRRSASPPRSLVVAEARRGRVLVVRLRRLSCHSRHACGRHDRSRPDPCRRAVRIAAGTFPTRPTPSVAGSATTSTSNQTIACRPSAPCQTATCRPWGLSRESPVREFPNSLPRPKNELAQARSDLEAAARLQAPDRRQQHLYRLVLYRHGLAVLRSRRHSGVADAPAACGPAEHSHRPGYIQPALHHARHGDDVPVRRAGGRGDRRSAFAADAGGARPAVSPPQRLCVLGLFHRRACSFSARCSSIWRPMAAGSCIRR